eukprot:Opistho-2@15437
MPADQSIYDAAGSGDLSRVRDLVEAGCPVDAKSVDEQTALITASRRGRTDIVAYLLQKGADVHVQDVHGETALLCAAANGHEECVALLVEAGADLNHTNVFGNKAADIALRKGYKDIARRLGATVTESDAPRMPDFGRLRGSSSMPSLFQLLEGKAVSPSTAARHSLDSQHAAEGSGRARFHHQRGASTTAARPTATTVRVAPLEERSSVDKAALKANFVGSPRPAPFLRAGSLDEMLKGQKSATSSVGSKAPVHEANTGGSAFSIPEDAEHEAAATLTGQEPSLFSRAKHPTCEDTQASTSASASASASAGKSHAFTIGKSTLASSEESGLLSVTTSEIDVGVNKDEFEATVELSEGTDDTVAAAPLADSEGRTESGKVFVEDGTSWKKTGLNGIEDAPQFSESDDDADGPSVPIPSSRRGSVTADMVIVPPPNKALKGILKNSSQPVRRRSSLRNFISEKILRRPSVTKLNTEGAELGSSPSSSSSTPVGSLSSATGSGPSAAAVLARFNRNISWNNRVAQIATFGRTEYDRGGPITWNLSATRRSRSQRSSMNTRGGRWWCTRQAKSTPITLFEIYLLAGTEPQQCHLSRTVLAVAVNLCDFVVFSHFEILKRPASKRPPRDYVAVCVSRILSRVGQLSMCQL